MGNPNKKAERLAEKENEGALARAKREDKRQRQLAARLDKEKKKYVGRTVHGPDSGGNWYRGPVCAVIIDSSGNAWLTINKGKYTINVRQKTSLLVYSPQQPQVARHNRKRRDKGV